MFDYFLFSLLPFSQHSLPSLVSKINRSAFPKFKIRSLYNPVINQGQNEPIGNARSKLLHQIQCQRFPSRPVPMMKPYISIKPNAFQR